LALAVFVGQTINLKWKWIVATTRPLGEDMELHTAHCGGTTYRYFDLFEK